MKTSETTTADREAAARFYAAWVRDDSLLQDWITGAADDDEIDDGVRYLAALLAKTRRDAEQVCDRKAADYDRLAGENARLTRERDEARAKIALLAECNEAMRAPMSKLRVAAGMPAEGESAVVDAVLASLAKKTSNLTAAEARAEALATAAKKAVSSIEALHDLCDRLMGDSDLDGDPDAKAMARALKAAERLDAALAATPPADLTQHPATPYSEGPVSNGGMDPRNANDVKENHPAYRAGRLAGIEEAAVLCAEQMHVTGTADWFASLIRALLGAKAVRDGR